MSEYSEMYPEILDWINISALYDAKITAQKNNTKCVFSQELGELIGGKLSIIVTFDFKDPK